MTLLISRLVLAILSALLLAAAIYAAPWVVSSSSLAFAECNGTYSLFADSARCRQPHVAALFTVVFFVASIVSMYSRSRLGKAPRPNVRGHK
jgi:hypothetical protein